MHFQRDQFIRIIEEQLRSFGFDQSVSTLERESRVLLEEEGVSLLREYCEREDLDQIKSLFDNVVSDGLYRDRARLVILKHQYQKLLYEGNQKDAILLLQQQITPLCDDKEVKKLAGMLVSKTQVAESDLFESLTRLLPLGAVVPHERLEQLLIQAKTNQFNNCRKHYGIVDLFVDQRCKHGLPSFKLRHKVTVADAQIWNVQFSHDGSLLAFASTDKTVSILSISNEGNFSQKVLLNGFPETPAVLSFSPNDALLFIGFDEGDGSGWVWSFVDTVYTVKLAFGRGVSSMVWTDNQSIAVADRVRPIITVYNVVCKREEYKWTGIQAASICYHCKSRSLFVAEMCSNSILCLDLVSKTVIEQPVNIPSKVQILGMTINDDHLVVSCDNSQLCCFTIERDVDYKPTLHLQSILTGHCSSENIFQRPEILMSDQRVMLGSEDGRVYVWRMADGSIETIIGKTSSRMPLCTAGHPIGEMIAVGDLNGNVCIYTATNI